mgnify:CR=1 FL=1
MPEFAFIDAVSNFLAGPAGLDPAPEQVGPALPLIPPQAPAIVVSLDAVRRLGGGHLGASPAGPVCPPGFLAFAAALAWWAAWGAPGTPPRGFWVRSPRRGC